MKVKLSDIRSATPRVRKELNLEKLDELAESIRETGGVIVPVKLQANGEGGYITVYGHRRIDACRLAGLAEIEAFIADVDDDELLTQALIENVVREGMSPTDIGKAFRQIKDETEWTNEQVGAKFCLSGGQVSNYMDYAKPEVEKAIEKSQRVEIPMRMLPQIKSGVDDEKDVLPVFEKALKEKLTSDQAHTVAEAVSAAPNEAAKKELLEHEYNPFVHDADRIKEQAKRTPGKDPVVQKAKPKADAAWREVPEVASMLEHLRKIEKDLVPSFIKLVEIGKLDKSGNAFVAGKVRRAIRSLETFIDVL